MIGLIPSVVAVLLAAYLLAVWFSPKALRWHAARCLARAAQIERGRIAFRDELRDRTEEFVPFEEAA